MKNITIAIVDENKFFTIKTKLFLIQEEYHFVDTYNSIDEFLTNIEDKTYDIVIIPQELLQHEMLEKMKDTIFLVLSENIEDIDNLQIFYLLKNFTDKELKQEIYTISLLKKYERVMQEQNKKLKEALNYITQQENMAVSKQLNMIYDNVSFKKIGNLLIDSFYSPKDNLSGDSYIALKTDDKIFLILIDAMGKGISASLTSTLISSLGNFILERTKNLKYLLEDYVNYIKKILLENEALCMILFKIDINSGDIQIVNFGMPPVYVLKNSEIIKIRPNNLPIFKKFNSEIEIETINNYEYDKIIIFSDGLIESPLKEKELPYLLRFKDVFKNRFFLRELLKDFRKNAVQDDDITIFSISKTLDFETVIYEKEALFSSKTDLDEIIEDIDQNLQSDMISKQKICLALQEIFLNIFEHAYRDQYDKQNIMENYDEFEPINGWLKIKILQNSNYYYIIIEDNGKGFDVTNIIRMENKINFKRYHRRGLLVLLHSLSGVFFDKMGKRVHIYIRREHEY